LRYGETMNLPIACTLTPGEFGARRSELLPALVQRALETRDLEDGLACRFEATPETLRDAAAMMAAEHQCCAFLRFELTVEPGDGPLWLRVTGPPGTRQFLADLARL
jgi:hypothetical protein